MTLLGLIFFRHTTLLKSFTQNNTLKHKAPHASIPARVGMSGFKMSVSHGFVPDLALEQVLPVRVRCRGYTRVEASHDDLPPAARAAEACKGHAAAGALQLGADPAAQFRGPMMDPRLSAESTSIPAAPAPAPR